MKLKIMRNLIFFITAVLCEIGVVRENVSILDAGLYIDGSADLHDNLRNVVKWGSSLQSMSYHINIIVVSVIVFTLIEVVIAYSAYKSIKNVN